MKIKRIMALVLALLTAWCALALADGEQGAYTVDLTGSGGAIVPWAVIQPLIRADNSPLSKDMDALDFNGDGVPDASMDIQKNNDCILKRLSGADKLTKDYSYDLPFGPYSRVTFRVYKGQSRIAVKLSAENTTLSPGLSTKYSCKLQTQAGQAMKKQKLSLKLKGKTYYATTNAKGIATFKVKINKKGTSKAIIKYAGTKTAEPASKEVVFTVTRQSVKIIAKNKTFKKDAKKKKYTCILKDSEGRPIKKAKLTMKVNGITYTVRTNAKGKATLNLANLKKKGKYNLIVKFAGNKCYKAKTRKVKITVN